MAETKTKAELEEELIAMKAKLEELEAEKEELIASKAPVGAGPTAGKAPEHDEGDDLVPINLFKDNDKYKDDVFVAVNGQRIQIRRGEPVMIKRKFADVLDQSMKQDYATASMIERESQEFAAQARARDIR